MNERIITERLHAYFVHNDFRLMNAYIYRWESDFFFITASNYKVEVEVKTTKSDYLADFKKPKHKILSGKKRKDYLNCPNRFYFCLPSGMIDISEVPEYAGVITYDTVRMDILRKAPVLHTDKRIDYRVLARKLYDRYLNQRIEIYELNQKLRTKIETEGVQASNTKRFVI